MWSLRLVDFHTLTLQLSIQSMAPELQVFVGSLENCQNFSKTSTPKGSNIPHFSLICKNYKVVLSKVVLNYHTFRIKFWTKTVIGT